MLVVLVRGMRVSSKLVLNDSGLGVASMAAVFADGGSDEKPAMIVEQEQVSKNDGKMLRAEVHEVSY